MTSSSRTSMASSCSSTGYASAQYAASLAEFGTPRHMPACGGWVLQRRIPDSPYYDAMSCYPLFCCHDWSAVGEGMERLGSELVSLVLVTDPFACGQVANLGGHFDRVAHYKDHYVADLDRPIQQTVKKSHRAAVRRAHRHVEATVCGRPEDYLEEWVAMYAHLAARHDIRGIRAFSRQAFAKQLTAPGMVMFAARAGEELVGLDLWYVDGDVAYGHLAACNETGYRLRASYAMKWTLMHYFRENDVRWVHFGGGAGSSGGGSDGLTDFKKGWASETKPAYLCTRVFQPSVYEQLTEARQISSTNHFPAYRAGEFE